MGRRGWHCPAPGTTEVTRGNYYGRWRVGGRMVQRKLGRSASLERGRD